MLKRRSAGFQPANDRLGEKNEEDAGKMPTLPEKVWKKLWSLLKRSAAITRKKLIYVYLRSCGWLEDNSGFWWYRWGELQELIYSSEVSDKNKFLENFNGLTVKAFVSTLAGMERQLYPKSLLNTSMKILLTPNK